MAPRYNPDSVDIFVQRGLKKKGMKKAPRPRPHICPTCPSRFDRPCALEQHIRVHTGEKPYGCKKCERPFATRSNLYRHGRTCNFPTKRRPTGTAKGTLVVMAQKRPAVRSRASRASAFPVSTVLEGPATPECRRQSSYSPPSWAPTIQPSDHHIQGSEWGGSSLESPPPPPHPMHESGSTPSMMKDQQGPQSFDSNITGSHPTILLPYRPLGPSSNIGPYDINHLSTHSVGVDTAKAALLLMGGLDEVMGYDAIPLSPVPAVPSDRTYYTSIPLISGDIRVESQHTSPPSPMAGHNIHRFSPLHFHYCNVPIVVSEFSPAGRLPPPPLPRSFDSHFQTHFAV